MKKQNGITIIALTITIIVILILAGVTVTTLTGDNGLLTKAESAKQLNEEATALEKIKVEVAGSYGIDGKIGIEQLNINLKNIKGLKYNGNEIVLEGDNVNKIEKLPTDIVLDTNTFTINQNGNVIVLKNKDLINSKIGNVVQGYNVKSLEWQVFYADDNETYLISKTLAKTKFVIPLRGINKTDDYNGSEDVRTSEYGIKWNKKWLDKCLNNESTYNNAKATAYMCDADNWTEYKIGPANYAVGGPTVELFIASWNKSQKTDVELLDNDINTFGVASNKPNEFSSNGSVTKINNGIYNCNNHYWIISPSKYFTNSNHVRILYQDGKIGCDNYTRTDIGVRPIVSIPTSKISVNSDTVTVNP